MMVYGYCRISTKQQSIERQVRNILAEYPKAKLYKEAFTGTKLDRPEFKKLLDSAKKARNKGEDVTIVFDSVSRMSRNADDGYKQYQELYNMGIELVFLKEPYINTATYRSSVKQQEDAAQAAAQANKCSDADTAAFVGGLMTLLNNYINSLTRKQIKQAFEQSQKEVDDLHERTREGIQTARLAGKQIGQREGAKLTVKKAAPAKAAILKHCADFGGTLSDKECMQLAGVSRNTYFKYKRELKEQQ